METPSHPWEAIFKRDGRVFAEPIPGFDSVAQELSRNSCRSVLDLGCGNGRHVIALRQRGFRVTGLDLSPSGLRLTREWLEETGLEAGLVRADFRRRLPFRTGSFDGLISAQVIHHAVLADIRFAIEEIWRVLAVGGIAFVTVAGKRNAEIAYREIEPGTYVPLAGTEKGLPHHFFTAEELRRECGRFQIREIEPRAEGRVLSVWLKKG